MRLIVLLFLILNIVYADNNCKDTLFAFDISKKSSNVKIIDIIENIAHKCKFSVKIKDDEAKKVLNSGLFLVHVEDYTLDDMFDFLFTQNNMFYKYDDKKNVLSISYLETRSFVIDYVNLSEHTTESTKTISVGVSSTNNNVNNTGTTGTNQTSTTSNSSTGQNGLNGGSSTNSDLTTVTSTSKFEFWDNLSSEIDSILSRDGDNRVIKSKSIINRDAGIVTITGTRSQINRIESYLEKVSSRLHKQVMLEAKLVEVTYSDSKSTGIDWSSFNATLKGGLPANTWTSLGDIGSSGSGHFSYNFSIDGLLDFLNTYGDVNVISTPKILTLNNQPAVINVGEQINYNTNTSVVSYSGATTTGTVPQSVFVGLTLNIVPEITDDGYIILRINPVISESLDKDNNFDEDGVRIMPPDTKIKQLSSIIKAKNGSRVVIGGLVSSSKSNESNKVQLLGDIPVLGYLFKRETMEVVKKELIIVVTPKIINYDNFPSIDNVESLLDGTLNE